MNPPPFPWQNLTIFMPKKFMPLQSPFKQKAFKGTELLHVKMMPTATWGNKLRQFRFFFWLKRLGEQKLVYNWLQRSLLISCTLYSLFLYPSVYIYTYLARPCPRHTACPGLCQQTGKSGGLSVEAGVLQTENQNGMIRKF